MALLRHALSQIMTGLRKKPCRVSLGNSPTNSLTRLFFIPPSFLSLPLSFLHSLSLLYFYCARVQEKTKRDTTDSRTDAGALGKQSEHELNLWVCQPFLTRGYSYKKNIIVKRIHFYEQCLFEI